MNQLCIAIYKEPGKAPRLIATFNHSIDLTRDHSFVDGSYISIEPEIYRAGKALVGTKEDLERHIKENMQGKGFVEKYIFYVPLFRIPENGERDDFNSWWDNLSDDDIDGLELACIAEIAFNAGRNS